nr:histidinol-phosphate transaminase [Actinomycetota bacterium]
ALTRCTDADGLLGALLGSSIVVRDLRHLAGLDDALRVTVGTDAEIDSVAAALTLTRSRPAPQL